LSLVYRGAFRLLLDEPADGRYNMAVDEALLESVADPVAPPVVRLYGFSPPTLSLGRFQATDEHVDLDAARNDGIVFVRRPTGGQAVLHDREVTYSVVMGRTHLSGFSKRGVYRFVADMLLVGLRELAIPGVLTGGARGNPRNPNCFAAASEYEIDSATGRKIIGSAQMVSRHGVLQHGSIPLDRSYLRIHRYLLCEPESTHGSSCISDECGREVTFDEAYRAFAMGIRSHVTVTESTRTSDEEARAAELLQRKYASDTWNRKY
jgi:lipoyl(octanoyl) transferase